MARPPHNALTQKDKSDKKGEKPRRAVHPGKRQHGGRAATPYIARCKRGPGRAQLVVKRPTPSLIWRAAPEGDRPTGPCEHKLSALMTSASPKPRPVAPYWCGWGVIYPSRERLCRACMGLYKEWRLPPPRCAHGPAALASTTNPTDTEQQSIVISDISMQSGCFSKRPHKATKKRRAPRGVRLPVCVYF